MSFYFSAVPSCDTIGCMDKNYSSLRKQAIFLRGKGLSYSEIKKEIDISKSTLSYWLKDVPLKPEHKQRFYTRQIQILSLGAQSQKERRKREIEKIIEQAVSEIQTPLTSDAYRLMGACLYWAEGSKGGRFEITNSDPCFILFMVKWLQDVFHIHPSTLKAWLNIYPQQNELEIKKFWSELTGITLENFGKSYIKPLSSGYKRNNLYYGTIRVEVPKSTDMKHRIFGWIKAVLMNIELETKVVQQKWQRLTGTKRPINL